MAKVLVLGSGGFIGRAVCRRLCADGEAVIALVRSERASAELPESMHLVRQGDVRDPGVLEDAIGDADSVINLIGSRDLPKLEPLLADRLLTILSGSGRTLVWTSGVRVVEPTGNMPGDESLPLDFDGPFGWRARVEDQVLGAEGMRSICIRPPIVYDSLGASILGLLEGAARGREAVPYPGDGAARWSTVHVDDLADLYVRALNRGTAGSAYIGASDDVVRIREMAQIVADRSARPVESLPLPQLMELAGPIAGMLASDAIFTGARARRELGWDPSANGMLAELGSGRV